MDEINVEWDENPYEVILTLDGASIALSLEETKKLSTELVQCLMEIHKHMESNDGKIS